MLDTTAKIISKFEEYIGDSTILSSANELELADKIYREILEMNQWEFLKKEANGSMNGTTIAAPSDFARFSSENVYIGSTPMYFNIVPFDDRRLYINQNNIVYYDARQGQLTFPVSQSDTYSFDYIYTPPELDLAGSNPVFPARFNYAIMHLMCVDSDIIELSEKARSYAQENSAKGMKVVDDMKYWSMGLSGYKTYGN